MIVVFGIVAGLLTSLTSFILSDTDVSLERISDEYINQLVLLSNKKKLNETEEIYATNVENELQQQKFSPGITRLREILCKITEKIPSTLILAVSYIFLLRQVYEEWKHGLLLNETIPHETFHEHVGFLNRNYVVLKAPTHVWTNLNRMLRFAPGIKNFTAIAHMLIVSVCFFKLRKKFTLQKWFPFFAVISYILTVVLIQLMVGWNKYIASFAKESLQWIVHAVIEEIYKFLIVFASVVVYRFGTESIRDKIVQYSPTFVLFVGGAFEMAESFEYVYRDYYGTYVLNKYYDYDKYNPTFPVLQQFLYRFLFFHVFCTLQPFYFFQKSNQNVAKNTLIGFLYGTFLHILHNLPLSYLKGQYDFIDDNIVYLNYSCWPDRQENESWPSFIQKNFPVLLKKILLLYALCINFPLVLNSAKNSVRRKILFIFTLLYLLSIAYLSARSFIIR